MAFNLKLTGFFNLSQIKTSALAFFIALGFLGNSQILINEASNKNFDQIFDEDNENEDWIELFNTGENAVNIKDWSITDNNSKVTKWVFPDLEMAPKSHVLIFASGKDRAIIHGSKWESAILPSDIFSYIIPDANVPNWNTLDFDASSWSTGSAGFGYGDDDDTTTLPEGTLVTYIRKRFIVTDLNALVSGICHVDYDDGFVAYINGIEICRSNVAGIPTWNSTATDYHEAVVPNGENPEGFVIDPNIFASALQEGENVFSIEVHNISDTSSDLSLSPYLSFSFNDDNSYFSESPEWVGIDGDTELHTNFKISSEGETVYLYNDSQELIDSMEVDIQTLNFSVGREKDGETGLAFFEGATPGTTNNNATAYLDGYEEMPSFSMPAGYHTSTINVSITSTSSTISEVRYTLDGSEPTITSTSYDGTPITLTNSTTINARAFSTSTVAKLPSPVNTNTYIINETFSVPVLSVTTDNSNLFDDDDGIFTNVWESWNKPCYIEYFKPDGTLAFQQKAGIQVDGGFGGSRNQPQTSFRIEPGNGIYGDGDLEYSFHPNRPNRDNYASLYLRNGSNRYLDLLYKDAAQVRGMGKGTNNFYSEYRPIVVFINGEYYGMYEGREKLNADYLESNYNMDTDSLDLVGISAFKRYETVLANEGSVEPFFEDYNRFLEMDTSSATYLEDVGEFLDLDNYTDYMAAQTWMTNKDWPNNNMKAWRCVGSGMRWQFALIDLEWSFLPTNTSYTRLATRPTFDQIEYMNNLGTRWHASGYWYMLMQNDDYKYRFINRLCDLMNTSYAYEELDKIETEMFEEAWPEIPAYYDRWTGGGVSEFQSNHEDFNNELSTREAYLRQHLRNHYSLNNDVEVNLDVVGSGTIKISTITPESYPWDGDYFSDVPITIEAIPNPGYQFVKWQDNDLITDLTKIDFTVDLGASAEVSFIAEFEVSSEPFTEVTITEINYKDGDDFETTDWFEIYNGTSSTISLDGWYFSDSDIEHRYDFESQVEIQPDSYLVVARYTEEFTENYPSVTNMVGGFDFGLGSNDAIKLYNADDELVVEVEYSDDAPWPLNEDDTGRTLELDQYTQDLSDPLAWFSGCFKGSPGSAYTTCIVEIGMTITEINYKDGDDFETTDWFEIYNGTSSTISLDGWYFSDSDIEHRYDFESQVEIQPDSYLVVARTIEEFAENYPSVTNMVGGFDFGLGSNDAIKLYNADDELVVEVEYSDDAPWPLNEDDTGRTLELLQYTQDLSDPLAWFSGCFKGSPGSAYTTCIAEIDMTITEISYKDGDDFETTDWFEIYNGTSSTISLDGWYFSDSDIEHRYDFESQVEIQPDSYLVVARTIEEFTENYPSVTNMVGGFDFGLGSNDAIRLYNADDELVVEVEYSDDAPWPLNGDDTGRTLELLEYNTQDLSDSSAWFMGCFKGSPGSAYVSNCTLSVNNKVFSDAVSVSPNPVTNILTINGPAGFNLKEATLYTIMGKQLLSTTNATLNTSTLPSGLYVLKIENTEGLTAIKKIIKQ